MSLDFDMVSGDAQDLVVDVEQLLADDTVDLTGAEDIIWAVGMSIYGPRMVRKSLLSGGVAVLPPVSPATRRTKFSVTVANGEITVAQDQDLRVQAWAVRGGRRHAFGTGVAHVTASVDV